MVTEGLRRTGLRRGGAHLAVHRRLQRHRGRRSAGIVDDPGLRRTCRCRCRACGSTPSPSASPARSSRARRTGLTFAPEAGTWRMRQVINKLIREEDLYGAVESAFSQGWRRMKLYFLTGLPTETDEDTLGIATLARNCVEIGRKHHQEPVGHRVGRRLRAQAVHAVPVVRPEHRARSCSRKIDLLRDDAAHATRACSSSGTTPRPRSSRASCRRGDRRLGAGHRGGVARTAAPSRSGPSTSTSSSGSTPSSSHGLDLEEVRLPAPHRGRGAAVGPHLGRPPQGLPLAGLARRARRGRPRGLPLDPLLRLRRLHRLRHRARGGLGRARPPAAARAPARTSRPAARCRSPSRPGPLAGAPAAVRLMRVRLRFTKLGKVRFTSHRDVARIWERALRRAELPLAYPGLLAPPQAALRAGPVHRRTSPWAEYLDIDLRRRAHPVARRPARAAHAVLPDGIDVHGRGRRSRPGTAVAAAGRRRAAPGGSRCWPDARPTLAAAVERVLAADELPSTRERKGTGHRRRHPALRRRTSRSRDRPRRASSSSPSSGRSRAGCAPPSSSPPSAPARPRRTRCSRRAGSSGRTSGSSTTAPGRNPCRTATSAPHATARAS